ncbi:MAG: AsmA family protein [Nitrospiraceae bacterium]|nr:AsmA family protein [Nitrospiraceae bacterium]
MGRFLKIAWAVIASLLVIIAGLAFFVSSYFRGERLKALIIPRIEKATGRAVNIQSINISLIRGGVVLRGIDIKEQDGRSDFLRAESFVLDYRLLPLLSRRLVINEMELDSPYLVVRRLPSGLFNWSDMIDRLKAKKEAAGEVPVAKKEKGPALTVNIGKVVVRNATAEFIDDMGKLPAATAMADADIKLSAPAAQAEKMPAISGEIALKSLTARIKNENLSSNTFGRISIGRRIKVSLETHINGDIIKINGDAANYMESPAVHLDVSSGRLDLDRLMPLLPRGGKKAPAKRRAPSAPPPSSETGRAAHPVSAAGRISVGTALYKGYVIKDFLLDYGYRGGVLSADPVRAALTGGKKVLVDGNLLGSASFSGGDPKGTLGGQGKADFSRIAVRESSITRQVANLLGMPELATPTFNDSRMHFVMKKGDVLLGGYMKSATLEFNPVNAAVRSAGKALSAAVDLRLSPSLAGRITRSRYLHFLTDQRGWTVVPLKISGTAGRPRVGIDTARLGKSAVKGLERQFQRELQKIFK